MNPNTDYSLRRVNVPKGGRFGRRVTRRDKLLGLAFGAVLLFGLWWLLLAPVSYSVVTSDVDGSFGWTERVNHVTHSEFRGTRNGNLVAVFVGSYSGREVMLDLATREQIILRTEDVRYPKARLKIFANAAVVCGIPDDCMHVAYLITEKSKDREAQYRADYRK